jgi:lipoate-protein ligase A
VFSELLVIDDPTPRSGPVNMAIDEVLLGRARSGILRFYQWNQPSLSFGYFVSYAEARRVAGNRMMVRRWTGGGIVRHGEDLTYSIIIPASDPAFAETSMSIYKNVHRILCQTLIAHGEGAELLAVAALYERRNQMDSAVKDRRYNNCFANPVRADVMVNGRKVAGAAQRKTRSGLLHQGSIQHPNLPKEFRHIFSNFLSKNLACSSIGTDIMDAARELAAAKYATDDWLYRR